MPIYGSEGGRAVQGLNFLINRTHVPVSGNLILLIFSYINVCFLLNQIFLEYSFVFQNTMLHIRSITDVTFALLMIHDMYIHWMNKKIDYDGVKILASCKLGALHEKWSNALLFFPPQWFFMIPNKNWITQHLCTLRIDISEIEIHVLHLAQIGAENYIEGMASQTQ